MAIYGYHRTSTTEQHLDRGIKEITDFCLQNNLKLEKIYIDQQTGKNFDRPRYIVLRDDILRSGDTLIITEVDRLGRNKKDTVEELRLLTNRGIRVMILEIPTTLQDVSKMDNAMAQMILETVNHMHILVQPIGEGYKQGLSHQISLTKALACDGFERSEKKGDRLSMTRWQDDIKDNIMEPILVRHKYTRAYKDGEKHHMPVAMYKSDMEEKDAIVEEAKAEAEQIVEKAREEVEELEEEKSYLINGNGKESAYDMPFEDLPIADLKCEKDFLINGDPEFSGGIFRGISELEEKHSEQRADIKDLEQAKTEKTAEIAGVEANYSKMWDEYEALKDGCQDNDGRHILGYNELIQRRKELLQDPTSILETEEGHWLTLNDNDRNILNKAVDKSISVVIDVLHLDAEIERDIGLNIPNNQDIELEVQRMIGGRRR